jgi:uncharacterized protein Yka (UPF0111/DUF47 family)
MSGTVPPVLAHSRVVVALFGEAAMNASQTARSLSTMLWRWPDRVELAKEIRALEHEGDRITHDLIAELEKRR